MGLLLKQLFQMIKLLNSENGSKQLAAGVALGFILGMSPMLSLQSLLVFAIIFTFRVQMGAAFLAASLFKFMAFLLDPAFAALGSVILESDSLTSLWTTLYNLPIIPFTRFNNNVVMGSGVLAIFLSPGIYFIALQLIEKYREKILKKFKETKFWKAVKATSLYKWYYKYDELYG